MRDPNPIDFWRGFALVNILVSHIPDNGYWRFTLRQFSWSDGAEILIFLSGWALALGRGGPSTLAQTGSRVSKIYVAHVVGTLALFFLYLKFDIAHGARLLAESGVDLGNHSAEAIVAGMMFMTTHIKYFDILPVYFAFFLVAPVLMALARTSMLALFSFSFAYYLLAQFGLSVAQWPTGRPWAFNPFAWQLLFALGLIAGSAGSQLGAAIRRAPFVFACAVAVALIGAMCIRLGAPSPVVADRSELESFLWDKSNLGVLRIVQFAGLAVIAWYVSSAIARLFPAFWRLGSLLGRHSLVVFTLSAILSALGHIGHRLGHHGVVFDTVFTASAIALMALAAFARDRADAKCVRAPLTGGASGVLASRV